MRKFISVSCLVSFLVFLIAMDVFTPEETVTVYSSDVGEFITTLFGMFWFFSSIPILLWFCLESFED